MTRDARTLRPASQQQQQQQPEPPTEAAAQQLPASNAAAAQPAEASASPRQGPGALQPGGEQQRQPAPAPQHQQQQPAPAAGGPSEADRAAAAAGAAAASALLQHMLFDQHKAGPTGGAVDGGVPLGSLPGTAPGAGQAPPEVEPVHQALPPISTQRSDTPTPPPAGVPLLQQAQQAQQAQLTFHGGAAAGQLGSPAATAAVLAAGTHLGAAPQPHIPLASLQQLLPPQPQQQVYVQPSLPHYSGAPQGPPQPWQAGMGGALPLQAAQVAPVQPQVMVLVQQPNGVHVSYIQAGAGWPVTACPAANVAQVAVCLAHGPAHVPRRLHSRLGRAALSAALKLP